MTDEKTKPVWIRHPGCQQLVFNEPLNINAHKIACPYDIKKSAQLLAERVEKLEAYIEGLSQAPAEAPLPDLDSIGSWDEAEPVQESQYVADEVAAYPAEAPASVSDDWDDDEDEASTVTPLR